MARQGLIALGLMTVMVTTSWAGVKGKEYKLKGAPKDGTFPSSPLVSDGAGNFYGATSEGGSNSCGLYQPSCGTVFRLSKNQDGGWAYAVIYTFNGSTGGWYPSGPLVMDAAGNIYGTSGYGGKFGVGTVFELSAGSDGSWTQTTLYSFQNSSDGLYPVSGVIFDKAGNLYGTTDTCQSCSGGTVFKLTPGQSGSWTETTLYQFGSGNYVIPSAVVFDAAGNLYGTTILGGNLECNHPDGCGAVFQLTPSESGPWSETVLYSFNDGLDGGYPSSGVTFDASGNLYGEASEGGSFACPVSGCGVIYELMPLQGGGWKFAVAHTFNGLNGSRGDAPAGGLVFDGTGSLYGTTEGGGNLGCNQGYGCGTIFRLSPKAGGEFTFRTIGSFNDADGLYPETGVTVDAAGNIYGTTYLGGDLTCNAPDGCGVVFEVTP
jgi:uncharacterized repeat protein (TIGR03803 family)